MDRYVIHACPQRMDYVNGYLVPSLEAQGIKDYRVVCDRFKAGNLYKCMEIFASMEGDGSTWHLQDDIIICNDFHRRTKWFVNKIVCGFCYENDDNRNNVGEVTYENMWWSFPCIMIPNEVARECAQWFYQVASKDPRYEIWIASKKYDDYFFREFLKERHPDKKAINLKPNLVDHIDWLIGGTTTHGISRGEQLRSCYFEDVELVDELEEKIKGNNNG